MLNKDEFLMVVKNTPLVSIDLVICSPMKQILMGQRVNRPAVNYWFVPGGRIYKDESLVDAFLRISAAELGVACNFDDAELLGAFTHLYADNFADAPDISTHYVVLAYQIKLEPDLDQLPSQQHRGYRWVDERSESTDLVHPNSQAYFTYLR